MLEDFVYLLIVAPPTSLYNTHHLAQVVPSCLAYDHVSGNDTPRLRTNYGSAKYYPKEQVGDGLPQLGSGGLWPSCHGVGLHNVCEVLEAHGEDSHRVRHAVKEYVGDTGQCLARRIQVLAEQEPRAVASRRLEALSRLGNVVFEVVAAEEQFSQRVP